MELLGRAVSALGALAVLDSVCTHHFRDTPELTLGRRSCSIRIPTLDGDRVFHGPDPDAAAFEALVELCLTYGYTPFARTLRALLARR